jgi:hypothetical protein
VRSYSTSGTDLWQPFAEALARAELTAELVNLVAGAPELIPRG